MNARAFASVVATVVFVSAPSARAETRRARLAIDELPRSGEVGATLAGADAHLPDGAREGGPVPRTWTRLAAGDEAVQPWHCTDARRSSLTTLSDDATSTDTIWERDGSFFLDRALVEAKGGRIHVRGATRHEVKRIVEGVWAYRWGTNIVLVTARDQGRSDAKWAFFGCRLDESYIPLPTGTGVIDSSPSIANEARKDIERSRGASPPRWPLPWQGVAYRVLATVSKTTADRAPMLNVVMNDL